MSQKIISIATKEIGYKETPANTNKTKYGKWFGYDGVPWCGMFVSWCYARAGFPLGNIGFTNGFAGCQSAVEYFRKKGMVTDKPKRGDIVFFDWNGDGRFDHTGLFIEFDKTGEVFNTVEGNTSIANQSNGGVVMLRSRKLSKGVLFVHPKILDK